MVCYCTGECGRPGEAFGVGLPFTVERLSLHRMLGVGADDELIDPPAPKKGNTSGGAGESADFAVMILDHLKRLCHTVCTFAAESKMRELFARQRSQRGMCTIRFLSTVLPHRRCRPRPRRRGSDPIASSESSFASAVPRSESLDYGPMSRSSTRQSQTLRACECENREALPRLPADQRRERRGILPPMPWRCGDG